MTSLYRRHQQLGQWQTARVPHQHALAALHLGDVEPEHLSHRLPAGATSNWGGNRRDSVTSRRSSRSSFGGTDTTGHLLDQDMDGPLEILDFQVHLLFEVQFP